MRIFIENGEIYSFAVTCWKDVFYSSSVAVKLWLFKSFCLCFYDAALWDNFTAGSLDKLKSAYVKCIKVFFGYAKYYSVTTMLTELNLQKFDTVIEKCRSNFQCYILYICI